MVSQNPVVSKPHFSNIFPFSDTSPEGFSIRKMIKTLPGTIGWGELLVHPQFCSACPPRSSPERGTLRWHEFYITRMPKWTAKMVIWCYLILYDVLCCPFLRHVHKCSTFLLCHKMFLWWVGSSGGMPSVVISVRKANDGAVSSQQ
jgi:hypothetical protein